MRAGGHDNADILWSNAGILEMAQESRHDAKSGRRSVQVIDDHHRASLASAKLPDGELAVGFLESARDLRIGQWFPYARHKYVHIP